MITIYSDEKIRKLVRELIDLCQMIDEEMSKDSDSGVEWYFGERRDAIQEELFRTPEEEMSILDQLYG